MVSKSGCDTVNPKIGGGGEGCTCAWSKHLVAQSSTCLGEAQRDVSAGRP